MVAFFSGSASGELTREKSAEKGWCFETQLEGQRAQRKEHGGKAEFQALNKGGHVSVSTRGPTRPKVMQQLLGAKKRTCHPSLSTASPTPSYTVDITIHSPSSPH